MKLIFYSTIHLLSLSSLLVIGCQSNNFEATFADVMVTSVIDGDTFSDGVVNYRILGIDTPETSDRDQNFIPTVGIENLYAQKAKDFLQQLILFRHVQLKLFQFDTYGRRIARVFYEDNDCALQLVSNGLARVAFLSTNEKNPFYTTEFDYYENLTWTQFQAWKNQLGFWKHSASFSIIFPHA